MPYADQQSITAVTAMRCRVGCRGHFWMPFDRVRWVRDGESFQAGDRTLVAVCPPFFDNPTTRGLLDTTTRVYWSVGRRERRCSRT